MDTFGSAFWRLLYLNFSQGFMITKYISCHFSLCPHSSVEQVNFLMKLQYLGGLFDGSRLVGGYFNCTFSMEERANCITSQATSDMLNDWLSDQEIWEVPLQGRQFTWASSQGENPCHAKLDSISINSIAAEMLQGCLTTAPSSWLSKHSPILFWSCKVNFLTPNIFCLENN